MSTNQTPPQAPQPQTGAVGFVRPPRRQRRAECKMTFNPEAERKRQLREAHNRFERAQKEWKSMAQDRQDEFPEPCLEDFLPREGQANVQGVEEAAAVRAADDDFHAPVTPPTVSDTPGANSPPPADATPAVPKPPLTPAAKKAAKAKTPINVDRETADDDVMDEPPQIDIP